MTPEQQELPLETAAPESEEAPPQGVTVRRVVDLGNGAGPEVFEATAPTREEALDILRPASDYLLQMAASGQIDLNNLARLEFRTRRRHEAAQRIRADHFHAEMNAGPP